MILVDLRNLFPLSKKALKFLRRKRFIAKPKSIEICSPQCFICRLPEDRSILARRKRYKKDICLCPVCLPFYERLFEPLISLGSSNNPIPESVFHFFCRTIKAQVENYPRLAPQKDPEKFIINCRHDLLVENCAICKAHEEQSGIFYQKVVRTVRQEKNAEGYDPDFPNAAFDRPKGATPNKDRISSSLGMDWVLQAADEQLSSSWAIEETMPANVEIVQDLEKPNGFIAWSEKRLVGNCQRCLKKTCDRTGTICKRAKLLWERIDRFSMVKIADMNFGYIDTLESYPTDYQHALEDEEVENRDEEDSGEKEISPRRKIRKELNGFEGADTQIKWSPYFGIGHVIPETGYELTEIFDEIEHKQAGEVPMGVVSAEFQEEDEPILPVAEKEEKGELPTLPEDFRVKKDQIKCPWCTRIFLSRANKKIIETRTKEVILPKRYPFLYRRLEACPFCHRNTRRKKVISWEIKRCRDRSRVDIQRRRIEEILIRSILIAEDPKTEIKEYRRLGFYQTEIARIKEVSVEWIAHLLGVKADLE